MLYVSFHVDKMILNELITDTFISIVFVELKYAVQTYWAQRAFLFCIADSMITNSLYIVIRKHPFSAKHNKLNINIIF